MGLLLYHPPSYIRITVQSYPYGPVLVKLLSVGKIPFLLLAVLIAAFGVSIRQLGYYLDDWAILAAYRLGGAQGLYNFSLLDSRPLVYWIWWMGFKVAGASAVSWQLWSLFWRWLSAVLIWLCWKRLWPKAPRQAALAALLFAVYPIFKQQGAAMTFSALWFCFSLYALSLYLMILSVQRPRWAVWLTLGSLALSALQMFSQEYLLGLELIRPFLLWQLLKPAEKTGLLRQGKAIFMKWLPYLLLLGGFLVWRFAFMPAPVEDRNAPVMISGLFQAPLATLSKWVTMFAQDVVEGLFAAWYQTYRPDLLGVISVRELFYWAAVVFTAGLIFFALRQREPEEISPAEQPGSQQPGSEQPGSWYGTAILIGFVLMVLGFLPGWAINRHLYDLTGSYNDRFGVAAMLGASLALVGIVEWLFKNSAKLLIVALLIGLGVSFNLRSMHTYEQSWRKQASFYWQLKWRAPEIEPPSAVMGDGALTSYMGSWANALAINLMYPAGANYLAPNHWYFDLSKINFPLQADTPLGGTKNGFTYNSVAGNSLTIQYDPAAGQCLWIIDTKDRNNPYISEALRHGIPVSSVDRIRDRNRDRTRPGASAGLPADIFGSEIPHTWCYTFQKADLARQMSDWEQVMDLWDQAAAKNDHPHNNIEYSPFIEAAAQTGDFGLALELTEKAAFPYYPMRGYLCDTWARVDRRIDLAARQPELLKTVIDQYECQDAFRE